MSAPPAFNRALSDLGPRADISYQIHENMLRQQDWSKNAGQACLLMRQAPSLPTVEIFGDTAVHRPRNQEPGSGYYGYCGKRDQGQPTNEQVLDEAVESAREDIQTVSDSFEQALANDGIRDRPMVNLPSPNPQKSDVFWIPSTGTKQRLYASAEAFLDQRCVPRRGTPKKGTFWRKNSEWRCRNCVYRQGEMWFTRDVKLCPRYGGLSLQLMKAGGMVLEAQNPRELEDGRMEFEEIEISTTYG